MYRNAWNSFFTALHYLILLFTSFWHSTLFHSVRILIIWFILLLHFLPLFFSTFHLILLLLITFYTFKLFLLYMLAILEWISIHSCYKRKLFNLNYHEPFCNFFRLLNDFDSTDYLLWVRLYLKGWVIGLHTIAIMAKDSFFEHHPNK